VALTRGAHQSKRRVQRPLGRMSSEKEYLDRFHIGRCSPWRFSLRSPTSRASIGEN